MRRRELSAKIERHLERGDELMERNSAAFERLTSLLDLFVARSDQVEARWEQRDAEWKAYCEEREAERRERDEHFNQRFEENAQLMREINLRTEKVLQGMVRHGEEHRARAERQTKAIVTEVKEFREESKAHREALLALIDRLPPAAAA